MSMLDSLAYWMENPTSEHSDLDATWTPSSSSNFSEQENIPVPHHYATDHQNSDASMSSSTCSTSTSGIFSTISNDAPQGWMGRPTSDLSDLGATWTPFSNSNFSGQENIPVPHQYATDSQNPDASMSSTCSSSTSGIFSAISNDAPRAKGEKKKHRPVKRVQRQAANQRERTRMKTINDTIEGLRVRIPMASADQKLSKVDTLRMAICYIQQLSELVNSCSTQNGPYSGKGGSENSQFIIKYHNTPGYTAYSEEMYGMQSPPLYGHSLPLEDQNTHILGPDNKMSATVWVPAQPTLDDISHFNALS